MGKYAYRALTTLRQWRSAGEASVESVLDFTNPQFDHTQVYTKLYLHTQATTYDVFQDSYKQGIHSPPFCIVLLSPFLPLIHHLDGSPDPVWDFTGTMYTVQAISHAMVTQRLHGHCFFISLFN